MHHTPLPPAFFLEAPDRVARALLGKLIIRMFPTNQRARTDCLEAAGAGELLAGRIVETEAYFGADDAAAHAFAGRTVRNEVLFGPPGRAYVYFVYGMHYCLNVSCEPEGKAGCVLIRALEPVAGVKKMRELRGLAPDAQPRLIASGPGRLCQALGITRMAHNAVDVTDAGGELVFAQDGAEDGTDLPGIVVGPRVGIRKAVDLAARFSVQGSRFVSGR